MRNSLRNAIVPILFIASLISVLFLGYYCGLKEAEEKEKTAQQECFIPHMNDYGIDVRDYQVELIDDGNKMSLILYRGNDYITEVRVDWNSREGKRILKDNL